VKVYVVDAKTGLRSIFFFFVIAFATHHTQQIFKAAVLNDSKAILKYVISRKQKACSCTPSTTGAAYAASGAWRA